MVAADDLVLDVVLCVADVGMVDVLSMAEGVVRDVSRDVVRDVPVAEEISLSFCIFS